MTDRQVKVSLIIDDHGSVKVMRSAGDESQRTEGKLKNLDKSVKGLGSSFGGLKNLALGGLSALGAGGLAFGLSSIASATKSIAAETEKFHTITGISASSSLAYTQALKARGLSGESVSKAFGFLAKNLKSAELQEAKYALSQTKAAEKGKVSTTVLGRQASALKELGINLGVFNRLSEQQKLEKITKSFEALAPGMQKTRLERELFGKGGNALSTVLEKNNLGLSHQLDLVKKYFPTIKGGANAMKELLEKQAESKMAWEGLEFTIGERLIPAMTKVMGTFSEVVVEVEKGKGVWGELEHTFEGIAKFAGGVAGVIKSIGDKLGIKVGGGSLGAVLLGIAGLGAVKHPGKAGSVIKKAKGIGKYGAGLLANPAAPAILAGGLAVGGGAAYGYDVYRSRHELAGNAEGALGMLTGGHGSIFPNYKTGVGYGQTHLGGNAAAGKETPSEAALVSRLIESMKPTNDQATIHLHLDSVKVAEAMLHSPRARRLIAESTAIYAQGMTARR